MVRDTCRYFSGLMYRSNAHALETVATCFLKNQITSEHYKEEETNKDYRFYDLLPQQQVTPILEQAIPESKNQGTAMIVEAPSTAQPAASEPASVSTDNTTDSTAAIPQQPNYILQVRSYTDPDQADARRRNHFKWLIG